MERQCRYEDEECNFGDKHEIVNYIKQELVDEEKDVFLNPRMLKIEEEYLFRYEEPSTREHFTPLLNVRTVNVKSECIKKEATEVKMEDEENRNILKIEESIEECPWGSVFLKPDEIDIKCEEENETSSNPVKTEEVELNDVGRDALENQAKCTRSCFVPGCSHNSKLFPRKLFIQVPSQEEEQIRWFQAVGRSYSVNNSSYYCCEDHFDVQKDIEHYTRYKKMGGEIVLNKGVIPHKYLLCERLETAVVHEASAADAIVEEPPLKAHEIHRNPQINKHTDEKQTTSHKKKVRHLCFVPSCTSDSRTCSDKIFVRVPIKEDLRKRWFEAVGRPYSPVTRKFFCCTEHFDLQEDMENYTRYKMVGGKLFVKQGIIPHLFVRPEESRTVVKNGVTCEDDGLTVDEAQLVISDSTLAEAKKNSNKRCFVPSCKSNSRTRPDKTFARVPLNKEERQRWFEAVGRQYSSSTTVFFVCTDHFNMEEDLVHYKRYKMFGGHRKFKKGVVPHIFLASGSSTPVEN